MEKEKKREKRICVEYKGGELILNPGHKVYELNLNSGKVQEHKLYRKVSIFFWRKPVYKVEYFAHLLHLPAYNKGKAIVAFRDLIGRGNLRKQNLMIH